MAFLMYDGLFFLRKNEVVFVLGKGKKWFDKFIVLSQRQRRPAYPGMILFDVDGIVSHATDSTIQDDLIPVGSVIINRSGGKKMENSNTMLKKMGSLVIAILLLIAVSNGTLYITDLFLKGSFQYTWLWMNHSLQLVIVLAIMILPIGSKRLFDWGVNVNNSQVTFRLIKKFAIGWILCTTLYIVISSWLSGWPNLLNFDLTFKNALIYLLFEGTIVGVSEELFFRGLIYGILFRHFGQKICLGKFSISQAGIITALLFAFAHTGIHLYPFSSFNINVMQFLMAFLLGVFYVFILEKNGSLLGPILAHNISDLWLSILYIALQIAAGM